MKKILYALMISSLVLLLSACGGSTASSDPASTEPEITVLNPEPESLSAEYTDAPASPDVSEKIPETNLSDSESEPVELSPDEFVSKISEIIDGSVGSDDSIDKISLENGNLLIVVTLGDPAPLSYEDLMFSRTSSITDEILSLEDCFELWDTITIDFGEHGAIKNSHDNIQFNGYGHYFQSENYVITYNE